MRIQRILVTVSGLIAAASMLVAGFWSWLWPRSFATFVKFEYHEHFLHDVGVFQIGIGVTLLAALIWKDTIAVALTGFVSASALHTVNHAMDQHLGGSASDPYALGALTLIAALGLAIRIWLLRATT